MEQKNNSSYRYVLVVIDNVSKYGFGVPLGNWAAQIIAFEVSNKVHKSICKPILIETDDGREFVK